MIKFVRVWHHYMKKKFLNGTGDFPKDRDFFFFDDIPTLDL